MLHSHVKSIINSHITRGSLMKKIGLPLVLITTTALSSCAPYDNNALQSSPNDDTSLTAMTQQQDSVENTKDTSEAQPYIVECIPGRNGDAKLSNGSIVYDNQCFDSAKKEEILKQEVYDGKDRLDTPLAPYGGHLSTGDEVFPIKEYATSYAARTHHECLEGKNDNEYDCANIFATYGFPQDVLK